MPETPSTSPDQNKPTSGMIAEADRGLAWRREYNRGGTEVGVARARDISNGSNLSDDTVKRMHSFFSRHEVDKKGQGYTPGQEGFPSAGRIAWALWGGDPGQTWAAARANRMAQASEQKASLNDESLSTSFDSLSLLLCGDNGMEFTSKGQRHTFKPDLTRGYLKFEMAHAFPNRLAYGTAIHPAVVARSADSLLHQNLNYEHQLADHFKDDPDRKGKVNDRLLGAVLAVHFPQGSNFQVGASPEDAPFISAVASYAKHAQGMNRIIGDHATGRHKWTVSMEVKYPFSETGFAVARNGREPLKEFSDSTPSDMSAAGYDYVSTLEAPEDLLATFSQKKNRIVKDYKGRKATLLMGGIDGDVHFAGVGLVKYGAEKTAAIQTLAASASPLIFAPFQDLAELIRKSLQK